MLSVSFDLTPASAAWLLRDKAIAGKQECLPHQLITTGSADIPVGDGLGGAVGTTAGVGRGAS